MGLTCMSCSETMRSRNRVLKNEHTPQLCTLVYCNHRCELIPIADRAIGPQGTLGVASRHTRAHRPPLLTLLYAAAVMSADVDCGVEDGGKYWHRWQYKRCRWLMTMSNNLFWKPLDGTTWTTEYDSPAQPATVPQLASSSRPESPNNVQIVIVSSWYHGQWSMDIPSSLAWVCFQHWRVGRIRLHFSSLTKNTSVRAIPCNYYYLFSRRAACWARLWCLWRT